MADELTRCRRWAECIDQLRIMPRCILVVCYVAYISLTYRAWEWFIAYDFGQLQNEAIALAVVGFPAAILSALGTVLGGITKAFFDKDARQT